MPLAPPAPRRSCVALGEAAGQPEKASVPPASKPSLPSSIVHCTWPGIPQEMGLQAPAGVVARYLSSTFPATRASTSQGAGGQAVGGWGWGGTAWGPDGDKPVPTWRRQRWEMAWTAVSEGFFTGGIVGRTRAHCKVTNLGKHPSASAACLLPGTRIVGAKSWPGSDSH